MKLDPRALPSTEVIQRTVFQAFQEKRTPILVTAGLVAAAALALTWFVVAGRAEEARLRAEIFSATKAKSALIAVDKLEGVTRDAAGSKSESFALIRLGLACYVASTDQETGDDEAVSVLETGITALRDLEARFPEDQWTLVPSPENPNTTLARSVLRKMKADLQWLTDHAYKHPAITEALSALIETERGNIRIGFFSQPKLAPKHVENFVNLAKDGFYNGLLFHRVVRGFVIQAGCPETRDRIRFNKHGTGGPGYGQRPEPARFSVNHLRGVVSTANGPEGESGSQFFICLEDLPQIDKKYTPFGQVVEGMDIVEAIGRVQTFGHDPAFRESEMFRNLNEHPTSDIVIRSISIWRDGKITDGHGWDTSIVGTPWKKGTPESAALSPTQLAEVAEFFADAERLEKSGKIEEAIEAIQKVLRIDPAHAEAIEKAAALEEKLPGEPETGMDDVMKEVDRLVEEAKLPEAIEKLEAVLVKDPACAPAKEKLAEIKRMLDDAKDD